MKEQILALADRAYDEYETDTVKYASNIPDGFCLKFAELLLNEHVNILRQEWYDLNNAPEVEGETPRDIGIRVGRKSEVNVLICKIKKHFELNVE
jgi:hypothetical protein